MINYYGLYSNYKKIRNAVWQCIIDFKVDSLPVKLMPIAHKANIKVVKNSDVNELCNDEKGVTLFTQSQCLIVYNDLLPSNESRYVIAHEFGHYFLGHEKKSNIQSEEQADQFAIRLLAPACVLHELRLYTAPQISDVCAIPIEQAEIRAGRMRILLKRDCFFTDKLEKMAFDMFGDWLNTKC